MNKPKPDEYTAFQSRYINLVINTNDILALLEQQQETSYNLFNNLSAEQAEHAYAEDKWTIKQVLGHMIDTERTFAYRALGFSRGQTELPGFDQDIYVEKSTFNNRTIQSLAEEFKATRVANLYLFRSLSPEQQERVGLASGNLISVRALVYITAGHELYHLNLMKERYL